MISRVRHDIQYDIVVCYGSINKHTNSCANVAGAWQGHSRQNALHTDVIVACLLSRSCRIYVRNQCQIQCYISTGGSPSAFLGQEG